MSKQFLCLCGLLCVLMSCKENSAEKTPLPLANSTSLRLMNQNWSQENRMAWWFSSQGTRILPYNWFLALEKPDKNVFIRDPENLRHYRFIPWPKDSEWNPDGLPIGFVQDRDVTTGTRYFGINCAACHTGKIRRGSQEYLIDGAPAHHDFDLFLTEIAFALQKTLGNKEKLARFSLRVLGFHPNPEAVEQLKQQLTEASVKLGQNILINHPSNANGYGRFDAFGNMRNAVAVFALNNPANQVAINAPVSYPVLWDTPHHDVLQWNGSAINTGIGPLVRDVEEVIGLFANFRIEKQSHADLSVINFMHSVNIPNLKNFQNMLVNLWSPLWSETQLPAINNQQAAQGQQIFEQLCSSCHPLIQREHPLRKITAKIIPLADIGTDPLMAANAATHKVRTGILEGESELPIQKYLANLPKFLAETLSTDLLSYSAIGILCEDLDQKTLLNGLSEYLTASTANRYKPNCQKAKDNNKCLRPVGYKARPLNGIWASAPYLHNGSVPNLWELLKPPAQRMRKFNVGSWEFDPINVGFITTAEEDTSIFDTSIAGNSNKGHVWGTDLSEVEKWQLLEFIKTL